MISVLGNSVYYLQYLNNDHEFQEEAEEFFLSLGIECEPVEYLTESGFEAMWEEVGVSELEDLDEIYRRWNGVDVDSYEFLNQDISRPMWDGDVVEISESYFMYQGDGWGEVEIRR